MTYVEEKEFTLRLVLRAEFPEDYDGELDGYEWAKEVPGLAGEVVRAAVAALARHPEWKVRGGNRGRSSEDEVMLVLERTLVEAPGSRES
jgi:hypothetical protein